ncbi:hypothetical protein PoB_001759100 [Plakobranchus ocellatus]|uniref:Uncharacterized protein n=1 Tax=Plakobranchus ocellatus TaxID=259542 RepID=A0AAV3YVF4_9GAST|nr:hypothetical protein PoB_001759100 [Plakobranchus ocellatus]
MIKYCQMLAAHCVSDMTLERGLVWFLYIAKASPQQDDFRLSGPPSGQRQSAGSRARTRERRIPVEFRAESLSTVPPTPPKNVKLSVALRLITTQIARYKNPAYASKLH